MTDLPPLEGWRPGHRIGPWVVDRVLDVSASGTTLLCHAEDKPIDLVHIKICDVADTTARRRFASEAAMLLDMKHPNIVPVRESHLADDPPWIVLAPGRAEDLGTLIRRDGRLPVGRALLFAEQVATALAFLHGRTRYHRDLRPESILVDGDVVRLTNFGLLREEGSPHLTAPGVALGVVDYSPPEWIDPSSERMATRDLYGLGAVLCEALTGAPAYDVPGLPGTLDRAVQIIALKRTQPHLDPGNGVPGPIRQLVRELTAEDPARRPQTAREVAFRLGSLRREVETGAPPSAPRPSEVDTIDETTPPPLPPREARSTPPPQVRSPAPPHRVKRAPPTPAGMPYNVQVAIVVAGGLAVGATLGGALIAAYWMSST